MKNTKPIKEAIQDAPNAVVRDLMKEFEEFAATMHQLSGKATEFERQPLIEKIRDSQERLRSYFSRVAASYGMTFDQFCAWVENKDHFAPADWEEIQANKKIVLESLNIPVAGSKKQKINNKLKI